MQKQRGILLTIILIIYLLFILQQLIRNLIMLIRFAVTSELLLASVILIINMLIVYGLWMWKKIAVYGFFTSFGVIIAFYTIYVYIKLISRSNLENYASASVEALARKMDLIIGLTYLVPVVTMLLIMLMFYIAIKRKWHILNKIISSTL